VNQLDLEDFVLPFGGKLCSENRLVILAKHIPWEEVETAYAQQFSQEDRGSPAKSSRVALGALSLKERLVVTDREQGSRLPKTPISTTSWASRCINTRRPFIIPS
jgi:hypothetical protein